MNQILSTKPSKNTKIKKKWFKIQLYLSLIIILIALIGTCFYLNNLYKNEQLANSLINNYSISQLYSDNSTTSSNKYDKESLNSIFGIIEIPEINIYYPIFSNLNEELLKVAPCKFSGTSLDENGNICVAGHNYDNSMFFSRINTLNISDKIFIFDQNGKKYAYSVTNIYEVNQSDLSPIFDYDTSQKILTLVTCNNFNSNRIIVRAQCSK